MLRVLEKNRCRIFHWRLLFLEKTHYDDEMVNADNLAGVAEKELDRFLDVIAKQGVRHLGASAEGSERGSRGLSRKGMGTSVFV